MRLSKPRSTLVSTMCAKSMICGRRERTAPAIQWGRYPVRRPDGRVGALVLFPGVGAGRRTPVGRVANPVPTVL